MTTYNIARNPRTTIYELHADGCRHLARLDTGADVTGDDPAETATAFEEANDGILVTVANCANRRHKGQR